MVLDRGVEAGTGGFSLRANMGMELCFYAFESRGMLGAVFPLG